MRIYLVGFMGAGKTTVGRLLAERAGWPFVDLDAEVERQSGATVRAVFESEGEEGFRRREAMALEATAALDPVVVATGGGTLTREASRRFLRRSGVSVWLHPPFTSLVERVGGLGKADRPLYQTEEQALELYRSRLGLYREADQVIDIEARESAAEVAARVALRLRLPEAPSGSGSPAPGPPAETTP